MPLTFSSVSLSQSIFLIEAFGSNPRRFDVIDVTACQPWAIENAIFQTIFIILMKMVLIMILGSLITGNLQSPT